MTLDVRQKADRSRSCLQLMQLEFIDKNSKYLISHCLWQA